MAVGQKQIVLLKGEKVILRLRPGDDFVYKLKGSSTVRTSYVNNLYDTAIVAHTTVVPFHTIDRIYFTQTKFYNRMGVFFVVGGVAYFLIDQINTVLVHGEKPSLDKQVTNISATAVAIGLPMMLLKKRSQKLGYKYRLLMVKKGSPFYERDINTLQSPFIPDDN